MKVAVLGASGRAGSEITKELAARGHAVVAVARKPEAIPALSGVTPVAGDASDSAALAEIIKGSDAVISALHHDVTAETLLSALKAAGVPRLLVTGGAGSLEVAPGVRLIDTPDFPEAFKPYALTRRRLPGRSARRDPDRLDLLLSACPDRGGAASGGLPNGRGPVDHRRQGREQDQLRGLRHRHGGRTGTAQTQPRPVHRRLLTRQTPIKKKAPEIALRGLHHSGTSSA